jgi:hypothetical protein
VQVGFKLGKYGSAKCFGRDAGAIRYKKNGAVGHINIKVGQMNRTVGRKAAHLYGEFDAAWGYLQALQY